MPDFGGVLNNLAGPAVKSLKDGDHKGGWRVVADITARDAILTGTDAAVEGMRVYVRSDTTEYQLDASLVTWTAVVGGPSFDAAARLYEVNHGTGDDTAAGDNTNPLATTQEAINRFLPGHIGVQNWALGDDRTIFVQDPGTANSEFQESIGIPFHAGLGALIIRGEETVHKTKTISGSEFNPLVGHEVEQFLLFTSDFSASAQNNDAFWVPQVNLTGDIYQHQLDMLPNIKVNPGFMGGPAQANVVALDPGSETAFSHVSGATVDLVSPVTRWQPGVGDPDSFLPIPCITNHGGALIVQGFRFTGREDSDSFCYGSVINNVGGVGSPDAFIGNIVWVSRSILEPSPVNGTGFSSIATGGHLSLNVIDKGFACFDFARSVRGLSLVNTRALQSWIFQDCDVHLHGVVVDKNPEVSAVGAVVFAGSRGLVFADLRDTRLIVSGSGITEIVALTVEGARRTAVIGGGPALVVSNNSLATLNGSRSAGTADNEETGALVDEMSLLTVSQPGTITLSGDDGDVQVGSNAVRPWTNADETDTLNLARLKA